MCFRYIIQSSLTHHLARRSLLIRYWCTICSVEKHFFNRCVFLGHLRSHDFPISRLDYSKISVNPLSIEIIKGGAVSSYFKECLNNSILPKDESILSKTSRDVSVKANHINSSVNRSPTTCSKNIFLNHQNTAVNQPKTTQAPVSLLLGKSNTPHFTCVSSTREVSSTPTPLNKSPGVPSVKNFQAYSKDTSADNINAAPKKVVLVLDKQNIPLNVKQNPKINVLPPNKLFSVSESMISGNDGVERPKESVGEQFMNFENATVANGSQTTSSSLLNLNITNNSNSTMKQIGGQKNLIGKLLPAKPWPTQSILDKPLKKACTECGVSCLNIAKHLNGGGRPNNPLFACKKCNLILPTKCAFKCHLRIHNKLPPYKCPECGKDYTTWDDLYSHLKMACGHFAKCVQYYCSHCKKVFPSKPDLARHISLLHFQDIYRCSVCRVAFYNKASSDIHMFTSVHKEEEFFFVKQKQCNLCPPNKEIVPLEEVESHVQSHTNQYSALIYAYRCPLCTAFFVSKLAFNVHQMKEMKLMKVTNNSLSQEKLEFLSQDTKPNRQEKTKKHNSHADFEFVVEQFPDDEDNLLTAEKDPLTLSADDCKFLQDQKVKHKIEEVCIVCKKNSVVLLPGVNENQQSLCCKQCVKSLDVQSTEQNQKSKKKVITSSKINNEMTTQALNKCPSKGGKRSYSGEKTQSRPRKQKKSGFCPNQELPDTESNVFIPVKKGNKKVRNLRKIDFGGQSTHVQGKIIAYQSPNDLVCAKCKYVADTKEKFQEHITVHRMDPNTYQCLECGLCFVVLPSLERHLRMNHGIKNVNEYTEENKASLPKRIYEEETRCLKENQCSVCLETYDSKSTLEKHFRIHGMAFMNSLCKSP